MNDRKLIYCSTVNAYVNMEEYKAEIRRTRIDSFLWEKEKQSWVPTAQPGRARDPDGDHYRNQLMPSCEWTPRLGQSYMYNFYSTLFKANPYFIRADGSRCWGFDHLEIAGNRPPRLEYLEHVPLMIEAPLNSVEIFEAVFKPPKPFPIYKAKHIPRTINPNAGHRDYPFVGDGSLPDYWKATQGKLVVEDREISYIVVPREKLELLKGTTIGWPVKLWHISISWQYTYRCRDLIHPFALVWNRRPEVDDIEKGKTYKEEFTRSLERLGLTGCKFEKSLLESGTIPLPENIYDYTYGIAGGPEAAPYFMPPQSEKTKRRMKREMKRKIIGQRPVRNRKVNLALLSMLKMTEKGLVPIVTRARRDPMKQAKTKARARKGRGEPKTIEVKKEPSPEG